MPEPYEDDNIIGPSLPFEGLLVKIADDQGFGVGGKMFLIPGSVLAGYEFQPQDQGQFVSELQGKLIHVDFAVYSPGFIVYASSA